MKDEKRLGELTKLEELKNKKLLHSSIVFMVIILIFFLGVLVVAVTVLEEGLLLGSIITGSVLLLVVAAFYAVKIEVEAGYYECKNCNYRFVPTYMKALMAPHIGFSRYLKCPECEKVTLAKKVMSK